MEKNNLVNTSHHHHVPTPTRPVKPTGDKYIQIKPPYLLLFEMNSADKKLLLDLSGALHVRMRHSWSGRPSFTQVSTRVSQQSLQYQFSCWARPFYENNFFTARSFWTPPSPREKLLVIAFENIWHIMVWERSAMVQWHRHSGNLKVGK